MTLPLILNCNPASAADNSLRHDKTVPTSAPHLCISGFLIDCAEDDSLKFELDLNSSYNEQLVQLLGHTSLNAMAECEWELTDEQTDQISTAIGQSLPKGLSLFIGVEA